MQAVLNHTDIPEERKVELYNQILQCYLTYKSKIEPPIVQVLQSKPKPSEELLEQTNDKNESLIDEIIASAPQKLKKRAHLLLKRLKQDPHLDWNEKGELIHKGRTIENTHINDLVQGILRKRKRHTPYGWKMFADALKESNVPQDLVGNVDRWNYMHGLCTPNHAKSPANILTQQS